MRVRCLSAGVVVVRRRYMEWSYLLLRAYTHWDFPKGMVEAGEAPLEAARREVWEETTLTGLQFYWGHGYSQTGPYNHGKIARYYLAESSGGEVDLPVSAELGRPEHEEFDWVSADTARKLLSPRVRPVLAWANDILIAGDAAPGIIR